MRKGKWRKGDLGRFECENQKLSRFELISLTPGEAVIWYAGKTKTDSVPLHTFQQECVNWWEIQKIGQWPPWAQRGARVTLHGSHARRVLISKVPSANANKPWLATEQTANLQGCGLELRTIRHDFASALVLGEGTLVMPPLIVAEENAHPLRTYWNRLDEGDDYAPDPDKDLFAGFEDV